MYVFTGYSNPSLTRGRLFGSFSSVSAKFTLQVG